MAHHQQTNHDRMHAMQDLSAAATPRITGARYVADEEELGADTDEPPDLPIKFSKVANSGSHTSGSDPGQVVSPRYRKASLLTQALTSPELTPLSDVEAPVLTSDGGMTSPARSSTPSPPLPALGHTTFTSLESKDIPGSKQGQDSMQLPQGLGIDRTQEVKVEEGLGRRRCISFACSQKNLPRNQDDHAAKQTTAPTEPVPATAMPPKRLCMLRFACPTKPSHSESQETIKPRQVESTPQNLMNDETPVQSATVAQPSSPIELSVRQDDVDTHEPDRDSGKGTATSPLSPSMGNQDRRLQFNRVDFQKSEATRFHEFAGSFNEEGEWANEQTAFRQKITINDTLRKENAIRKLAEEAEEEALEEDEEAYNNADDDLDELSDDGNETDDEEGFAESDDESDDGSAYQFWTPGNNTAATSTDHIEHIRSVSRRVPSESSIDSVIDADLQRGESSKMDSKKPRKVSRSRKSTRPGTPDIPDSSDFVIGTIDEDQPLEEEYMSRLKQKERSKQKIIPQDIDPSFPTSDPEAENDDEDELEEEEDDDDDDDEDDAREAATAKDKSKWATGAVGKSVEDDSSGHQSSPAARKTVPNPSPRRLHSPPPTSRRLFGQAVHRLRSPPPMHRKLMSPPSSRRPSLSGSLNRTGGIDITRLAQRPNLTHTTSLPRTPNPFWGLHRRTQFDGSDTPSAGASPKTYQMAQDTHSRGPIEIVQGLENKRQRRKEKFWRQHCQKAHAGKEKERKCQPGKGAQRMREVGLVMADRFKGYKQGSKLVLSV